MINENSKKNLKPFKKGDDPRRCRKGKQALPDLKELMEELGDEGIKAVVQALYAQAKKGNVKAIQEVLDRYYGKVKQEVDNKNTNINYNAEVSRQEAKDISDALEEEV